MSGKTLPSGLFFSDDDLNLKLGDIVEMPTLQGRVIIYCHKCKILGIRNIFNSVGTSEDWKPFLACKRANQPLVCNYNIFHSGSFFIGASASSSFGSFSMPLECEHEKDMVCYIMDELPGSLDKCMACSIHYRCLFFMNEDEWRKLIGISKPEVNVAFR